MSLLIVEVRFIQVGYNKPMPTNPSHHHVVFPLPPFFPSSHTHRLSLSLFILPTFFCYVLVLHRNLAKPFSLLDFLARAVCRNRHTPKGKANLNKFLIKKGPGRLAYSVYYGMFVFNYC